MPMRAGITWEAHKMSILTIIKESKARYLVSTSSDFDNEYQPEQQRNSLKVLVEQHPRNFLLVFESTSGSSTIYRIETGESDLFSRGHKNSPIPWDYLEREDRKRFCPNV